MPTKAHAVLLFFAVLVGTAGCDHASKQIALSRLAHETVSLAGDTLRLELAHNAGAFLSTGEDLPEAVRLFLLGGVVPLIVLLLCAHFLRAGELPVPLAVGLGLVAGGGLSNWVDRLFHDGYVTDFILLRVGALHTGVFNVADVAVMAGALLVVASHGRRGAALATSPADDGRD